MGRSDTPLPADIYWVGTRVPPEHTYPTRAYTLGVVKRYIAFLLRKSNLVTTRPPTLPLHMTTRAHDTFVCARTARVLLLLRSCLHGIPGQHSLSCCCCGCCCRTSRSCSSCPSPCYFITSRDRVGRWGRSVASGSARVSPPPMASYC